MATSRGARPRAVPAGLAVLVALVLAAGCRVDVSVDVVASADETGEIAVAVVLDADAAAEVPDLAEELAVDDLQRAGWEVSVADTPGGGVEVRAVRPFTSFSEATLVAEQLTGPDGPVALTLRRRDAADATAFSVEGEVDLTDGLGAFADAGLRRVVGGSGIGFDEDELAARAGRPLDEAVTVRIRADLPGRSVRGSDEVEAPLGEATAVALRSEVRHDERRAWLAAAGVAVVLLVGVLGRRAWHSAVRTDRRRGNVRR